MTVINCILDVTWCMWASHFLFRFHLMWAEVVFAKKNNRIWILYYRASPIFKFLKDAKLRLISALNFNLGGSQLWTEFQTQYFYCIIRGFCPDFFGIFISKVLEILFFRFVVRNHLTAPQVKNICDCNKGLPQGKLFYSFT